MPFARDYDALPAGLTDGSLILSLEFYGLDENAPLDQTGQVYAWSFAPLGKAKPASADVHTFEGAGQGVVVTGNIVTLSLAGSELADWMPAAYAVEVRRKAGSDYVPIYLGTLPVARGISDADTGGMAGLPGAPSSVRKLFFGPTVVRVVQGAAASVAAQVSADAAAAHADRLLADADAAATAADRVQTGLDRAATGADRVQTGLDRAATAADRVQTGLDRTATAADRAQADADAAATAADRTATHADKLAADADATATAADRVQTGLDRTAASGSASAAAGSATTATTQAGIATTKAGEAAASAAAAAASAASVASQSVATLVDIEERVAIADPNATAAQRAGTVARGVENRPAASTGKTYFRSGLLASTSLSGVATFTRATTATQTDQSGVISAVTPGQARVSNAGLLVEEARTNLALRSQDITVGPWSSANVTTATAAGTAPDGTNTACSLAASSTASAYATQAWTVAAAVHTFSIYVRALAASRLDLGIYQGGFVAMTAAILSGPGAVSNPGGGAAVAISGLSSTQWTRVQITTVSALAAAAANVYLYPGGNAPAHASGDSVLVWGAQLEAGAFATSYLPTTTATVARNADVAQETVSIPVGQAFTVTGKFIAPPAGIASTARVFELCDATTVADRIRFNVNGGGTSVRLDVISAGLSVVTFAGSPTVTPGLPVGFAISVSGDTLTWSINGAAAVSGTLPGGAFATALTLLGLGCSIGGAGPLNSTLRELNIVMRAMSAAEVAAASDVSLERDLDFTTQTYQYIGEKFTAATELPATTFARAASAFGLTVAGYLLSFGTGVLRATDAGVTIEPASINLLKWSQDISNAAWFVGAGGSVAADTVVAPDGTTTADALTWPTSTTSFGHLSQSISGQNAALTFTFSAWLKLATGSKSVRLRISDVTTTTSSSADCVLTTSWQRFTFTVAAAALTNTGFVGAAIGAGGTNPIAAGDVLHVWGLQLEQLGFGTTYVPTTSATASRPGDVLATLDAAPASFCVAAEFTIPATGDADSRVWDWNDGTTSNRCLLRFNRASGRLILQVDTGGVNQVLLDLGAGVSGSTYKVAARFNANDVAASLNGAAVVTDTTVTLPSATVFRFGASDGVGSQCWGAGLRKVRRWRGTRTNAQLQADAA